MNPPATRNFETSGFSKPFPERWFLTGLIILALLLGLATINRGLQSDDYLHRALLNTVEYPEQNKFKELSVINDLFVFFDPQKENPSLPWWTNPELKIKFWRPFSALTHYIDYQLWPDNIKAMHVHSMFWYLLLVLLSYAFFKQVLGSLPAQWAAIIFCLDFSHFANISWLANRNSLIAASGVLLTCLLFIKAYQFNQKKYFLLSLFAYGCALLSAEVSITTLFILISYLYFFREKQSPYLDNKNIFLVFSGYLIITLIFFAAYRKLGYGMSSTGLYLNPLEDYLLALQAILLKIPVFYFGQIYSLEGFFNVLSWPLKLLGSFFCLLLVIIFFRFLQPFYKSEKAVFFIFSSIIALIPVTFFALADMRLNLLSSVFSAALLGLCLTFFYRYAFIERNSKKSYSILLLSIFFVHVFLNGGQWLYTAIKDNHQHEESFPLLAKLHNQYSGKTVYIFNHPKPLDLFYFDQFLEAGNTGSSQSIHILNSNFNDFTIEAIDERHLKIFSASGFVFTIDDFSKIKASDAGHFRINTVYAHAALASVFRAPGQGFLNSKLFFSERFSAEISRLTESKKPGQTLATEITFSFENDFEAQESVFLIWRAKENRYEEINMSALLESAQTLQVHNQAL